jgi:hypothetical protein
LVYDEQKKKCQLLYLKKKKEKGPLWGHGRFTYNRLQRSWVGKNEPQIELIGGGRSDYVIQITYYAVSKLLLLS